MKKAICFVGLMIVLVFLMRTPAQAEVKLGFKLTGGLGYYGAGDLNTGLLGWSDVFRRSYSTYSASGGYSPVHWGMDFGGELLLHLNPKLALGLGVGYLQASRSSSLALSLSGSSFEDTWSPKIGAVPVTLNLHYYLPLAGAIRLSLDAGMGYYFGTCTDTQHIHFIIDTNRAYDTTASGIGFHGGLGIEIPFSPAFAFLIEVRGRYASLGNFKGAIRAASSTASGSVWMADLALDRIYSVIDIFEEEPSDYNPRLAKLDFSGFSTAVGFVIRFGGGR